MDYNVSATAMNHTLNHTLNHTMNHTMNHTAINSSSPAEDVTLNVFERYTVSQLVETFAPAAAWAERVVPPIWYFVGFFGNPVSAYVWLGARMRRNNSSAVYLGLLAVSDLVFLFLHLLHTLHVTWGRDVYNAPGGCEAFMFFFYIPQYLSVVLVAAFTVERYVAVCHPFLKEKWCTERRAFLAVGACTGLSAALSTAQLYIWTFFPTLNICNTRPQAAEGGDASFWNVWTWVVDMLLFALLPLVVLLFNALVLREIVRLSRNGVISRQVSRGGGGGGGDGGGGGSGGTTASTLTLLCVSFFLIVTQLAATLVNTLQSAYPPGPHLLTDLQLGTDATWRAFFTYLDCRKVLETLCLSHYSCYFFVYCLTGKHFRREVRHLLTCQGRLSCGSRRGRRGERYSMVSSNGHSLNTTNCTMAFTTSI